MNLGNSIRSEVTRKVWYNMGMRLGSNFPFTVTLDLKVAVRNVQLYIGFRISRILPRPTNIIGG